MDYRYLLFVERGTHLEVLERLAEMSVPGSGAPTTLTLPGRTLMLPYSGWGDTGREVSWDDRGATWDFMCVLCFEPDDSIERYLGRLSGGRRDPTQDQDEQGRARVGYVYLTVHRDMADRPSGTGEDLVLFAFSTPGSSMSVLFLESESIRRAFVHLLESCHGVYGLLDREDEADLFWWRGQVTSETIPTAEMRLADIEELVGARAPQPLSHRADEVVVTAKHLRRRYGGSELRTCHWLLALLDTDTDLSAWLGPRDPTQVAADLRRRLGGGDAGDPLPEAQVRARATLRARRSGAAQVRSGDLAAVVAEAAADVDPGP